MTTAMTTTMSQINDLIGSMRKNNHAACVARYCVQFFDILSQAIFLFEVQTTMRARSSKIIFHSLLFH